MGHTKEEQQTAQWDTPALAMWPQPCSDYSQIREVPAIAFAIEKEGREEIEKEEAPAIASGQEIICVLQNHRKLASGGNLTCALHPATPSATTGFPRRG